MISPQGENAGPSFGKPDPPEKPSPPPIQERQGIHRLLWELDKILACALDTHRKGPGGKHANAQARPPTSLGSRILEGVLIVGVAAAMLLGLRGDEFLAAVTKQARLDASRITEAGWEAEWIIEQAQHYQRAEGRNPGSIAELGRRFPHSEIQPTDPWGRDWVVSATFQDTRTPANPADLWVCSRGPAGTGRCPPENLRTAPSLSPESIGYSVQLGAWAREFTWRQRLSGAYEAWSEVGFILFFFGPLLGYVAYRTIRRAFDRPAPALRGELGILMTFVMIFVVGFGTSLPLRANIQSRARLAKAQADVRTLAGAVTTYAGHTGKLPATLADLTGTAVDEEGLTAGPFMASVPRPPAGWSRYRYKIRADWTFTITSHGDGVEARAP